MPGEIKWLLFLFWMGDGAALNRAAARSGAAPRRAITHSKQKQ